MSNQTNTESRPLALLELHKAQGAKIADFAGWLVPIYYTSILEEHECVRTRAGLFDISHMGVFLIEGADSRPYLNRLLSASLARLKPGAAVYSLLTNLEGGIIDDVILYEREEEKYFLIVNASNIQKDWSWLTAHQGNFKVTLKDISPNKILFALQGPAAEKILSQFLNMSLSDTVRFQFKIAQFAGQELILCRTGYTGEDGFEMIGPRAVGEKLWQGLLKAGEPEGIRPIGFGARDTLRIEARYPLYGHELNDETTPLEAGLGWAVDLGKSFPGNHKLLAQKEGGTKKRLIGFEVLGRQIPREKYALYLNGKKAGFVVSGCMSPTLKKNIGLGYVECDQPPMAGVEVEVRNERVPCRIVNGPFYIGASLAKFKK